MLCTKIIRFHLIRHAQSEANALAEHIVGGVNLNVDLTDKGKLQARKFGEYIKTQETKIHKIYSSNALRTQETCRIALGKDPDIITSELLEVDKGDFSGMSGTIYSRIDIAERLEKEKHKFIPGIHIKGESNYQASERMRSWLQNSINEISNEFKESSEPINIFVFTHGVAIKCLLVSLLGEPWENIRRHRVENTSFTVLEFIDGKLKPIVKIRYATPHLE